MDVRLLLVLASVPVAGCAVVPAQGPVLGIEEASGVVRLGDDLFVVGDHESDTYYRVRLAPGEGGRIRLSPERLERRSVGPGAFAADLEAIGVLADGRLVVLSERLAALLDARGLVAGYGRDVAELGGRGVEGVAVRALPGAASRVAVLWEGGYPEVAILPAALRERAKGVAMLPLIVVHDLPAGARSVEVGAEARLVQLDVPRPPGEEPTAQRFRAPDLVWHRLRSDDPESWGFIVLLSSGWAVPPAPGSIEECRTSGPDGRPLRWCHKWLQRFTAEGARVGEPFDLENALPEPLRTVNWEGLAWFEPERSLVLVYDERVAARAVDPQEAVVVPLPEGW
ncbi:MAG: hypothetical protein ACT4PE_05235 [Candidatus Eiseniibacteriota bacterium]